MKNLKSKFVLLTSILLIPVIVSIFVIGCGKKKINSGNPEFSNYISAFTSGIISKTSSIKIRLVGDIVDKLKQKSTELPNNLFDFSPSIKGEYFWADENTIEFKPEKFMPSDEKIVANFKLNKIAEVTGELKNFTFEFQTIKQAFDFNLEEQKTIDRKTLKWQQAIGNIKTADYENLDEIKKMLSATQQGKKLKIDWRVDSDGKTYYFVIDSILRSENASAVILNWDGNPIKVKKSGKDTLHIPSINDFKLLGTKLVQHPEQYLNVQFSDPLEENQNLQGLINLKNIQNLRFIIEDNIIKIYPPNRLDGTYELKISEGIKNILGVKLSETKNFEVAFEDIKPALRFVNKGVILPLSDEGLIYPFEAVNLKAVDVTIIKIFENNIIQFLQVNDLGGEYQLTRVGRPIFHKTIKLTNKEVSDFGVWNRFTLDLNKLIKTEPGAIYRIKLSFRKQHSLYNCGEDGIQETELSNIEDNWAEEQTESTYWDGSESYYNNDYYEDDYYYYGDDYWENRENPCHNSYYGDRRAIAQNILASNIGLIAKKGNDGSIRVLVSDIKTTKPLQGVTIELLNYQNQVLKYTSTDANGIANFQPEKGAYFIIAKMEKQRSFLKISDGNSLSLSRFDVGGNKVENGIKGFIYGERGVWRPGDSIYITFILQEDALPLPENHPIILELKNPKYQIVDKKVAQKNKTGFYTFVLKTESDAPTGNYEATITAGGAVFNKQIKVETIKPNRLKIDLEFEKEELTANENIQAKIIAKWLHGASASNLKASVEMYLTQEKTSFPKYEDYSFTAPMNEFSSYPENIYSGELDENGIAKISNSLKKQSNAPGKLKASFLTKVFEKGGDFSTDQTSIIYNPYKSYTGIKLPKGDKIRGMLLTDTNHVVEIVVLDPKGNKISEKQEIEMEFYKMTWAWWWEQSSQTISNYMWKNSFQRLANEVVWTSNGTAAWKIRVNYPEWGRYLVVANNKTTGHTTGKIVYIDWPGWAGRAQKETDGATMLAFVSDKPKYNVDEMIKLTIPSGDKGRALISIENGTKVIETKWIETYSGDVEYSFKATKDMAPNIFVNITMIQPHAQTANDRPIRLYGVIPISVEDPKTKLEPIISMPEKLEAESTIKIKVSEKNKQPMTYTLALVDEGLLDLTNFKTPNPWNEFYAREALGVKTWDLYDWIIGAYGGKLERLLSLGGDGENEGQGSKSKANRFKPVVAFLGPFTLNSGENTHTIKLPKYIGAVRTMVVAGYGKAYGCTEKSTPVVKPLMVLGTLPRVLGPGEQVKLPVSVFVMEDGIKNVNVTIKTNDILKLDGANTKEITFRKQGEEYITFDIKVASKLGVGKAEIIAQSGNYKATYQIELDVRNPNPPITKVITQIIQPGEAWESQFDAVGIDGTNKATIEVSNIPPMNLEKRTRYLITYPHGCIEQTTSGAFPQLYLADIIDLKDSQKKEIEFNIKSAIQKIVSFQTVSGGLSYWPGNQDVTEWGTNYAGHFLIEAEKKGYAVSNSFMKNWKKYQKTKAKNWINEGPQSQLTQSYRLYTLALAGDAETGAMNRLKELKTLENEAKWHLAAAYYLAGKEKTGEKMLEQITTNVKTYTESSITFGSEIRDKAIILETMTIMGKDKDAFVLVKEIAEKLSTDNWYSTQTTAYSLISISKYINKYKSGKQLTFSYNFAGKAENISAQRSISLIDFKEIGTGNKKISLKNTGAATIYARVIYSGVPEIGALTDADNNLKLQVSYFNIDGSSLDHTSITQGTDFIAEIKVMNPGFKGNLRDIALSQVFPSGWEIINTRLFNLSNFYGSSIPVYQDIKDDRVYTYFHLNRGSSQTYRVLLNASYLGKFYYPGVYVEAMYDATVNSSRKGNWVEVVKSDAL